MGAVTPAKRLVQRSKAREESSWAQDGGREYRETWKELRGGLFRTWSLIGVGGEERQVFYTLYIITH